VAQADLAALRVSVAAQTAPEAARDEPAGETETMVAEIWREVLGLEHIGWHDRFAEVGGTSFKALAVYGRLRRRYPDFAIAQLYAHPTIAELAVQLSPAVPGPSAMRVIVL
jgi:aryl carrier-like protein